METQPKIFDTRRDPFPTVEELKVGNATKTVGNTTQQFLLKTFLEGEKPLFVKTPTGNMKQGFIKSANNKYFCDLAFATDESEFFEWIEKMEQYCIAHLYQHQRKWFQTELSLDNIGDLFISPFKIHKASKTYSIRCGISDLGNSFQIFDVGKRAIQYDETFLTQAPVICVLEIVGIRCTPRNFQLEIEMKQMMQLQEKVVEKMPKICLIDYEGGGDGAKSDKDLDKNVEKEAADSEMKEIELVDDVTSLVKVKDSAQVYQSIYEKVLQKAIMARDLGILNYFEEKKIGNTQVFLDL